MQEDVPEEKIARLREIIATPRQHPVILADAYDTLVSARGREIRSSLQDKVQNAGEISMEEVQSGLLELLPDLEKFEPETSKELKTAEYFYQRQGGDQLNSDVDFSRNIGFSYCFAVDSSGASATVGTRPVTGTDCAGVVPQVTYGTMSPSSFSRSGL